MPRFSSTGLRGLADLLQQVEVLHVPGADLEHVGVLLDELDLPRVHDLGDDRHVVLVADVAEDLQAVLAHALEGVRAGPRLERAAAEDVRAGLLDVAGDRVQDLAGSRRRTARRSWPGGRRRSRTLPTVTDGVVLVELAAGELERLQDRQDLLDAGDGRERLGLRLVLVADDADDGALLAAADVRA